MTNMYRALLLLISLLLVLPVSSYAGKTVETSGYNLFFSEFQAIDHLLQNNQYGVPVHIKSRNKENSAAGEVFARINHNFNSIAASLDSPRHWCDVLLLHINVKGFMSVVDIIKHLMKPMKCAIDFPSQAPRRTILMFD